MFTISSLWYLLIFLQTGLCFGYRTARLGICMRPLIGLETVVMGVAQVQD